MCHLQEQSYSVISGSADASVRVWDIQMGTCVHKLSGHTGGVTSVICSSTHVISVGMDDRLCIWDRSKGHLIHCMQLVRHFFTNDHSVTTSLSWVELKYPLRYHYSFWYIYCHYYQHMLSLRKTHKNYLQMVWICFLHGIFCLIFSRMAVVQHDNQ